MMTILIFLGVGKKWRIRRTSRFFVTRWKIATFKPHIFFFTVETRLDFVSTFKNPHILCQCGLKPNNSQLKLSFSLSVLSLSSLDSHYIHLTCVINVFVLYHNPYFLHFFFPFLLKTMKIWRKKNESLFYGNFHTVSSLITFLSSSYSFLLHFHMQSKHFVVFSSTTTGAQLP